MAEYEGYTGVWRRLKSGAAIFIRDGEDIKSAIRRNYNSQKLIEKRKEIIEKEDRVSLKTGVNDKDIENDIRSLFIYKNEKGMGSLDAEPLKRYYDKHGKENVDRVWKQMEDKYEVIEGTAMDSEGLRYNNLIEKSKYSPEAIQDYKNKMKTIYEKFGTNSRKYNEAAKAAADEFEKAPKISTASVNNSLGGYKYYTKHGMGPGAVPTDVKISNIKDYDDGMTSFETNRPLSSKELNFYSIENEIKNAEYDVKYGHNSTSDSKIKNYTNSSVQDLRKAMRNMKPYEEEIQIGGRVITKTSNGYGVRNQYDYDDPMTDYSAYVYGFKEKWIIDEAVKKGELKQTELKAKVERFRERKGTSSSNNNGSVESLSKQALIERIVDDQISRGVVKAENRALQIRARQNMTKSELLKYFK